MIKSTAQTWSAPYGAKNKCRVFAFSVGNEWQKHSAHKSYIREIGKISALRNYTTQVDAMRDSRDILRKTLDRRQKTGKSPKILTTCHRQNELHITFLFKSAWLLLYSILIISCHLLTRALYHVKRTLKQAQLFTELVITFEVLNQLNWGALIWNWFSTSKVMTSPVKKLACFK